MNPASLLLAAATAQSAVPSDTVFDPYPVAYRRFFKTRDPDYPKISDVIEIVPVGGGKAYVNVALDFAKGHSCHISGMARRMRQSLVYKPPLQKIDIEVGFSQCTFEIEKLEMGIVLHDRGGACQRQYCGARGSFEGAWYSDRAKRPISYNNRLKSSPEFKDAMAAADGKEK